ncbi:MAG: hypothetical protein EA378_08140 [Phycisphaerales bacterium]|nr:MAG: hypothetical protein EA378_08140 [Phycisphaerales bacterium]
MADEQQAEASPPKKKSMKTILIVAGLMILEGVAVLGFVMMTGLAPGLTKAMDLQGEDAADRERPVEILLMEDKFPNLTTGRVWLYDAQIWLRVRQKNVPRVEQIMERRRAEIAEQVGLIFSRAQDRQLKEPGRETITRQLQTYLQEVFEHDADGLPRVERVMVPVLKPILADL